MQNKTQARVDGRRKERAQGSTAMATPVGVGIHGFVRKVWCDSDTPEPGNYAYNVARAKPTTQASTLPCPLCAGSMVCVTNAGGLDVARIASERQKDETTYSTPLPVGAVVHSCRACDVEFVSLPEGR